MNQEILKAIVEKVAARYSGYSSALVHPQPIPTGVSNRHVHLSEADMEALFGEGYVLRSQRSLSQTGQFAAVETVSIAGPDGCIENVRILGPVRKQTQVEVSGNDTYKLGIFAPVRESGNLSGSPDITVIGPKGSVHLEEGLIIAKRHIHMTPADARKYGLEDGESVQVRTNGERGLTFDQVVVRVNDEFVLEFHIDIDEANASGIKHGDTVNIVAYANYESIGKRDDRAKIKRNSNNCQVISLVTEDIVRSASKSGTSLVLKTGAIITPLAKDAIKELNVDITIGT